MTACVTLPSGVSCPTPSTWSNCRPWDLTAQNKTACYIDNLQQEALAIAGAQVNVYKLLGVHEQTKTIDLTGSGVPISGGDWTGFPAANAYKTTLSEWRSKQSGTDAIVASSYIGYDFGELKLTNGRDRYGIDASVRYHITMIRIKQSSSATMRVTKARVERSENGSEWYGVAIIDLPNNDSLNSITFKHSVPNRYWRIRPLVFTGTGCDSWGVQALELIDYMSTQVNNIQDMVLMENRNRDYATTPVQMKGYYDLLTSVLNLTMFGAATGDSTTYSIKLNFNNTIAALGRPVIVGDIIELPSETQYSADLKPVKRWLEVSDVTWDPGSYTPGWQPTLLLITAKPALASEETQDIFGDLAKNVDSSGLFDNDDGNSTMYQDFSAVSQTIQQEALTEVPERGAEGSNTIREFTPEEAAIAATKGVAHLTKIGLNSTGLYVEDALPSNGAPYTEGPDLPNISTVVDGAYHRLVYAGLSKDVPPRLYRYSTTKGRWVYLETDRRQQFNNQQQVLSEYLSSPFKKPAREIK